MTIFMRLTHPSSATGYFCMRYSTPAAMMTSASSTTSVRQDRKKVNRIPAPNARTTMPSTLHAFRIPLIRHPSFPIVAAMPSAFTVCVRKGFGACAMGLFRRLRGSLRRGCLPEGGGQGHVRQRSRSEGGAAPPGYGDSSLCGDDGAERTGKRRKHGCEENGGTARTGMQGEQREQ